MESDGIYLGVSRGPMKNPHEKSRGITYRRHGRIPWNPMTHPREPARSRVLMLPLDPTRILNDAPLNWAATTACGVQLQGVPTPKFFRDAPFYFVRVELEKLRDWAFLTNTLGKEVRVTHGLVSWAPETASAAPKLSCEQGEVCLSISDGSFGTYWYNGAPANCST